jgi:acyl-[acyl-carrier-protein]-phospholipid O-acyltransferase/long-chain-fatty-acid--[acyl-carrier-protein] ligase
MLARISSSALGLRYRIEVDGLEAVAKRGTRGICFLANHPALIDPMILLSILYRPFRARPVGDREEISRPIIRWVAGLVRAIAIADPAQIGSKARTAIEAGMAEAADALRAGDNLLIYPSGHLMTSRYEDLRGNSGVHRLLEETPEARVVLIAQHGLWGSRFSRAQTGVAPKLAVAARRSVLDLLHNGLFFLPRRQLSIIVQEPTDLPRRGDRETLNAYLEAYFNHDVRANTFVPYSAFDRRGPRLLPDPVLEIGGNQAIEVPQHLRETISGRLQGITGIKSIADDSHLARDLGCDSIVRAELVDWIGENFGPVDADLDAVRTVHDLLVVATGSPLRLNASRLENVPPVWFDGDQRAHDPAMPEGESIVEVFLRRALAEPRTVILADQTSGVRTYRDLLTGIFLLKPLLGALPGKQIGLMMPASVAADVLYLGLLCAGKTPVMVNWTVGPRQVVQGLEVAETKVVLTARALAERLAAQGVTFDGYENRLHFLEDVIATITSAAKLRALVSAHLQPKTLLRGPVRDIAVILFTSGSESQPKAVPLSHRSLLANLRDIARLVPFEAGDRLLSVLPPFHSFGLTAGMLMPLLNGIPTVHSPNPRDAAMLASLVGAYRATLMGGTPTFLGAMLACAGTEQLASLRMVVTGGETCTDQVFEDFANRCPEAMILEGYGITECSPIVSINSPGAHRRGSIGRILPSLEHTIVNMETGAACPAGEEGVLLVRGPSVFEGYLGREPGEAFVDHDGQRWFATDDVVAMDTDGFLSFRGRKGRFIKRAGEMLSLPAIESALAHLADQRTEDGPSLAVVALGNDASTKLILCTTISVDRERANREIRNAGLSPLHSIHRVILMAELPVLGTGKTDYRSLQEKLESATGLE